MIKRLAAVLLSLFCFIAFAEEPAAESASDALDAEAAETPAKNKWGFKLKDENPNPHEVGFYFKDYFPVARMNSHCSNFAGGGISYTYHSPFTFVLPNGQYWNIGFSGHLDFVGANKDDGYIQSWWTANIFGGAFFEIVFCDWFELQPSVEYGFQVDVVKSTRKANGSYFSQSLLLSPTAKFKPIYTLKDNLSFDVSPFWQMSFEADGLAHYLGFRLGVMYRIGGKKTEKSSSENVKVVEKVVVKEVPVYIGKTSEAEETQIVEKATVEENGDGTLKVKLPVFEFVSDKATLTDNPKNEEIISQLHEILNDSKYADYKCNVIGYVNSENETWSGKEKRLAAERAETIMKRLVEDGIDKKRLSSSHGSGKTENKIYNRRVEVKLYK